MEADMTATERAILLAYDNLSRDAELLAEDITDLDGALTEEVGAQALEHAAHLQKLMMQLRAALPAPARSKPKPYAGERSRHHRSAEVSANAQD
jgi:hypothetical protein